MYTSVQTLIRSQRNHPSVRIQCHQHYNTSTTEWNVRLKIKKIISLCFENLELFLNITGFLLEGWWRGGGFREWGEGGVQRHIHVRTYSWLCCVDWRSPAEVSNGGCRLLSHTRPESDIAEVNASSLWPGVVIVCCTWSTRGPISQVE